MSLKVTNALSESNEIVEYTIENDINKLFEAIDIGSSRRAAGQSERAVRDGLHKSASKRPMRSGSSGIGISETVSLKQALRGLSISQASEMAKRISRPSVSSPGVLETVDIKKRLYRAVVIGASESGRPVNPINGNVVEISLVPERNSPTISDKIVESVHFSTISDEGSMAASGDHKGQEDKLRRALDLSKRRLKSRNFAKKKIVPKMASVSKNRGRRNEGANNDRHYDSTRTNRQTPDYFVEMGCEESMASNSTTNTVIDSIAVDSSTGEHIPVPHSFSKSKTVVIKADEKSRSREKEEISQSSKSSIGEYSSSTSYTDDSCLSGSRSGGRRPHMSKDSRWEAINSIEKKHGSLSLRHFKLLRKLGGGDIGNVYVSELIGTSSLFAVKVMDNELLTSRKKMLRAQTEKEILEILNHPFLPTLYAHFTTNKFTCLVMEYCPGGDLHVLRQNQVAKSFPEQAARFYAAEVLLALEYLHMLGVVYRDLKPENILIRDDGHIMLSDFDLSLKCAVNNPTLLKSSSIFYEPPTKKISNPCSDSSCINPFCLDPSFQLSCFTPRFLSAAARSRKLKSEPTAQIIVEPTAARSNSFVGTHEYLAPEIIKGEGHGSAVDWWTFGILVYEMLYGTTPFKGSTNEETISNVGSQCLEFPHHPMVSSHARDLIGRLLKKEPENRLGSTIGAAEIKRHTFFEGLNFALIRRETPPELPEFFDLGNFESECRGDGTGFETF